MANLKSIAEQVHGQLFPQANDEAAIDLEDFIATAKTEYAYQMWLKLLNDRERTGELDIPSYLLSEKELDVENNEMDISSLKVMRGLHAETWLQNIGGISCSCLYMKTTFNRAQILCDDDGRGDAKRFYPKGKKIYFPDGVHKNKLTVTYANNGEEVDDVIEIDDVIGGVVRRTLYEVYANRGQVDKTNNSNPNA